MAELDNVEFFKAILYEHASIGLMGKFAYEVLQVLYTTPVLRFYSGQVSTADFKPSGLSGDEAAGFGRRGRKSTSFMICIGNSHADFWSVRPIHTKIKMLIDDDSELSS
ncbi:hypothetical protein C8J57DRAFT_1234078 [Mycena rebaudengoi]|nr:hypothetical protein C8J57DRAFT_1234078 [Mycena rebaudengoi]